MNLLNIAANLIYPLVRKFSIRAAIRQQIMSNEVKKLCALVPDISNQQERESLSFDDFWDLKRRGMHAFQCRLMLQALKNFKKPEINVVDIGVSAGTHMIYLRALTQNNIFLNTISVNLDPRAIKKIKERGLKAILKRAEEITPEDLGGREIDLFTTFEMVEHLHNPALFFRRLAKMTSCNFVVITVPLLRQSRVGLHSIRQGMSEKIFAEDEHIFELCPEDWTLLLLHAGWRVKENRMYYQYPRHLPLVSYLFRKLWTHKDFEGFWGAILEKDTTISDLYQDWET